MQISCGSPEGGMYNKILKCLIFSSPPPPPPPSVDVQLVMSHGQQLFPSNVHKSMLFKSKVKHIFLFIFTGAGCVGCKLGGKREPGLNTTITTSLPGSLRSSQSMTKPAL